MSTGLQPSLLLAPAMGAASSMGAGRTKTKMEGQHCWICRLITPSRLINVNFEVSASSGRRSLFEEVVRLKNMVLTLDSICFNCSLREWLTTS